MPLAESENKMSTKTVEQNAREFWLENSPYGSGASTYAVPYHHKDWLKTIYRDDAIHVIEYSAFEAAQAEIKEKDKMFDDLLIDAKNLSAQVDQLESKLEKAEREIEKLKWQNKQFEVYGTDGCNKCEDGRVTIYRANKSCISCDPDSYDSYELQKLRGNE